MIWDALRSTAVAIDWNPLNWDALTWGSIVALLVVLWLLIALRQSRRQLVGRPELLVSRGEITAYEADIAERETTNSLAYELRLTLSNLNPYPVQVLELSLKTEVLKDPVCLELSQLLAPNSSARLSQDLPEINGVSGKLSLYFYAAATAKKYFRLDAMLNFEPWEARYKISPLDQKISSSKRLASAGQKKQLEQAWRAQETRRKQELSESFDASLTAGAAISDSANPETATGSSEEKSFEFPEEF